MAYKDFLQIKVDEIAHNEILAFLMVILGMVTLVGGLLVTIVVVEAPRWFLIFPYQPLSQPCNVLGLILTLTGFILLSAGFVLVIYYDRKRSWATKQLEEFSHTDKSETVWDQIRQILEKYADKK